MSCANYLIISIIVSAYLSIPISTLSWTSINAKQSGFTAQEQYLQERELNNDEDTIVIWYPNWSEAIAFSYLAKVALEEKEYEVKLKKVEPRQIYDSLRQGKGDLYLDAWLPNTHADYWQKHGDELTIVGTSFTDGQKGLAVPSYVEIDSIGQLNKAVNDFEGKIIGVGTGSIVYKSTKSVIQDYNLDYRQIASTGPAMILMLKKAYKNREPVVVTLWKPHYIWRECDLKFLKDPKNIYTKDSCKIISRKNFSSDYPEVKAFLSNFTFTHEQLLELLKMMDNSDKSIKAAELWYKEHKDMIENWW